MVLQYSPGFYPFFGPSLSTHPGPSSILARIPLRHSPGFHLFSTCRNSTLSDTCSDSTFPALTQILPFPSTHPGPSPVLARIPHFRHSPDFTLSGTCPKSTFSSTHPDSTFSALARTLLFTHLLGFNLFRYLPRFLLFLNSPGFCPFLALAEAPFRHSLGFHLSRTCPNSTLSNTHPDSTFPALARILPFPVLA